MMSGQISLIAESGSLVVVVCVLAVAGLGGRVSGRRGVVGGGGRRGVKFVCVAEIKGGDQGSGWGWVPAAAQSRSRRVRLVQWPIRRLLHLSGAHFSGRARASWWGCASSGGDPADAIGQLLRSIGSALHNSAGTSSPLHTHAPTLPPSPHSTPCQQPSRACQTQSTKK